MKDNSERIADALEEIRDLLSGEIRLSLEDISTTIWEAFVKDKERDEDE